MYLFNVTPRNGQPHISCGNDGTLILRRSSPRSIRIAAEKWFNAIHVPGEIYAMPSYTQSMCEMEPQKFALHVIKNGRRII